MKTRTARFYAWRADYHATAALSILEITHEIAVNVFRVAARYALWAMAEEAL